MRPILGPLLVGLFQGSFERPPPNVLPVLSSSDIVNSVMGRIKE